MNSPCPQASEDASEGVRFTPADVVRRRKAEWNGLRADTVEMTRLVRFDYGVRTDPGSTKSPAIKEWCAG
jgi:hypothetical protein